MISFWQRNSCINIQPLAFTIFYIQCEIQINNDYFSFIYSIPCFEIMKRWLHSEISKWLPIISRRLVQLRFDTQHLTIVYAVYCGEPRSSQCSVIVSVSVTFVAESWLLTFFFTGDPRRFRPCTGIHVSVQNGGPTFRFQLPLVPNKLHFRYHSGRVGVNRWRHDCFCATWWADLESILHRGCENQTCYERFHNIIAEQLLICRRFLTSSITTRRFVTIMAQASCYFFALHACRPRWKYLTHSYTYAWP